MIKNLQIMKAKYFILGLILSVITLQSCDNDNDIPYSDNELVETAFVQKYPGATGMDWEKVNSFSVVDFYKDGKQLEAWFDQAGVWYLTETDLPSINALPDFVKEAFLAGDYATWRVDDIDMIERKDMETIYVVEVEKGSQEFDLYYSPVGTLIKVVAEASNKDDNEHYLPVAIESPITAYIQTHYPQARILEVENERGMIEVDIMDGNICRELLFKSDAQWVHTKTGVRKSAVPQLVINALERSEYATYGIDDIYFYETASRNYYYFELESKSKEVDLIITLEGNIEVVKISND